MDGKHLMKYVTLLTTMSLLVGCGANYDSPIIEETTVNEALQSVDLCTDEVVIDIEGDIAVPLGMEIEQTVMLSNIPIYAGDPYVTINGNQPFFRDEEMTTVSFENYAPLDTLGRCGTAYANICLEIMPTEERGEIGQVRPSGWHTVKYNDLIEGNYLYNRCHLIGYQLAGENANECNLITGTRYLNVQGMLPFENEVADYVESTGNHVLYRVTPMFEGQNLVASGVLMEAKSVEDQGKGVCFCTYIYNVQPGIMIDYATGESQLESDFSSVQETSNELDVVNDISTNVSTYILNTNTKKFHIPTCKSVKQMKEKNKKEVTSSREEIIAQGYDPCKNCNP